MQNTSPSPDDGAASAVTGRKSEAIVVDLEHRIVQLETMEDALFGRFSRRDWWFSTLTFLVIPYLCYLWFWPA